MIKIGKGVYRYDPSYALNKKQEDFTAAQKKIILERGDYRCALCGRGRQDGVELHVDHIKPKDQGGKAIIENGQVLCSQHNFLKKNLNQTSTGKRMFINLYNLAKAEKDFYLMNFCAEILAVFEKYGMNGHIEWNR